MTNIGGEEKREKSNKQGDWTLLMELIDMRGRFLCGFLVFLFGDGII